MTPAEEFFKAVRDVFAKNRDADWPRLGLLLSAAVVLTIGSSWWLGRWRSRRRIANQIDALANAARLNQADRDDLNRIAASAGLPVLEVMTSVAPFEHATAAALAAEEPTLRPPSGSVFERIRRLRTALGFSPLSPHLWLLTTRELVVGDPVAIGSAIGRIVEVNEAAFAIDLPAHAAPAPTSSVAVTIDRPDDARYLVRTRVLEVEERPGASAEDEPALRRAFFAHDEQPERQQHRAYVRVRVKGSVTVWTADPIKGKAGKTSGADVATAPALDGALVDVSAGGLALDLPISPVGPIRRGARLWCSFTMGESEVFERITAAVVATATGPRTGVQHLRLSFTALAETTRDRLAAAVTRHQVQSATRR